MFLVGFVMIGESTFGQDRIKIKEGLYIVDYAGKYVVEDDVNQRSISVEIKQDQVDNRNSETMYNVICGKWTKRVTKYALKTAVAAGIKAAAATSGASLIISATAEVATWIYDDFCENWEKEIKQRNDY